MPRVQWSVATLLKLTSLAAVIVLWCQMCRGREWPEETGRLDKIGFLGCGGAVLFASSRREGLGLFTLGIVLMSLQLVAVEQDYWGSLGCSGRPSWPRTSELWSAWRCGMLLPVYTTVALAPFLYRPWLRLPRAERIQLVLLPLSGWLAATISVWTFFTIFTARYGIDWPMQGPWTE